MPLGGFAPLPLRLGDDWSPEQHARLCADVAAMKRTAPLCVFTYSKSGATITIESYTGRDGEGLYDADGAARVAATNNGAGDVTFTLAASLEDANGRRHPVNVTHARATLLDDRGRVRVVCTANVVHVRSYDGAGTLADGRVSVAVHTSDTAGDAATTTHADFRDYGGDLEKRASATEGKEPYAWAWYRELQAMRGSAYSQKTSGTLVHCENLAIARLQASLARTSEKLYKNSIPSTSDEKLEAWATALAVPTRPGDRRADLRARCAAKFQAVKSPTNRNVDDAVAALLGEAYVRTDRSTGAALSTPPAITHWPGVNPGPASYAITKDTSGTPTAWLSERCHTVIVVQRPAGMSRGDFAYLMNIQLFELLDNMLPAWATFNWTLSPGFLLDISQLDFTGL
jgi:hypothetical protein